LVPGGDERGQRITTTINKTPVTSSGLVARTTAPGGTAEQGLQADAAGMIGDAVGVGPPARGCSDHPTNAVALLRSSGGR
jgi:hypothetical protein